MRFYDAQVWSYNHTSVSVISYKDWRLHKFLVKWPREDGVWKVSDGKQEVVGKSLKECLNKSFGQVNMDDIGHVLPCTPAMCIGSGGGEFFNIVAHQNGLMIESFLWEAQGVERRIALVPFTRGGGLVASSGRYSHACYRDDSGSTVFLITDVSTGWEKRLIWRKDLRSVIDVPVVSGKKYSLTLKTPREILFGGEKLNWKGISLDRA